LEAYFTAHAFSSSFASTLKKGEFCCNTVNLGSWGRHLFLIKQSLVISGIQMYHEGMQDFYLYFLSLKGRGLHFHKSSTSSELLKQFQLILVGMKY
jgi:hypothetical protein